MNPTEHTLWVSVIIVGFVVVVAVAALLSLLIYLIKRIDRRVVTVRDTLKAAKATLKRFDCTLGKVRPRGRRSGHVKKQSPKPGTVEPAGGKVNVTLR